MHRLLSAAVGVALCAALAGAQARILVREVGPADATSVDTVSYLYGVRELSDGRLVVNDAASRRLMMFDAGLARMKVVADSSAATRALYGKRPTGIIPYLGGLDAAHRRRVADVSRRRP